MEGQDLTHRQPKVRMTHPGIDTTRPQAARVYDRLLGGIESYAADRKLARGLLRICPALGIAALENRYFLARAVTWAAGQGVAQFIDLGAGIPVRKARAGVLEDIHVTAQTASPVARVAYVDDDPVVLARSRAFRAPARGVAVIPADLTDPGAVLADLRLRSVIDLAQPACFIFGLVLGLIPAAQAGDVVAGYMRLAAPGSRVVMTSGRCDDEALWTQLNEAYPGAQVHNHARAEVAGFLDGLELVPPGLVAAPSWRAGWREVSAAPPGPVYVLAAVAQKRPG
jgi:S-adenosyl methyltransferase